MSQGMAAVIQASEWQPTATLLSAAINGIAVLTGGVLAFIFGRLQKEHEVRFTRLYERSAEVIANLYSTINKISNGFENWYDYHNTKQYTEREQTYAAIGRTLKELHAYYLEKDIWINSDTTRNKIQKFYDEVHSKWSGLDRPFTEEELGKEAKKVVQWVNTRRVVLRADLESEFRRVLGVKVEPREKTIIQGWRRIVVGLLGTVLIGGVVGYVVSLLFSDYIGRAEGMVLGTLVGLGVGLMMEYIRSSRCQRSAPASENRQKR